MSYNEKIELAWKGLSITTRAAQQLKNIINENYFNKVIRLKIKKSGCAGFEYVMELVKNPQQNDLKFTQDGINLFVDYQSMPFIDGTEIDYTSNGLNKSFKFHNPKAQNVCGCGESFSIE